MAARRGRRHAGALLSGIPELVVGGETGLLGIKNKVLEAFCAGTPVVANPTAVDGAEGAVAGVERAVAGEHFVLADGADETARAIGGLFADPARRIELARAARELVLSSYTWERRADQLFDADGLTEERSGRGHAEVARPVHGAAEIPDP